MHAAPPDLLERALQGHQRRAERRRLLLTAVVLLGLGWLGGTSWTLRAPSETPTEAPPEALGTPVEVLDLLAPDASTVAVVGSWNQWQATPMIRREGTFFTVLRLPPGRYEYMFLVDGQRWVPDPDAPLSRDDGFGQRNSILDI